MNDEDANYDDKPRTSLGTIGEYLIVALCITILTFAFFGSFANAHHTRDHRVFYTGTAQILPINTLVCDEEVHARLIFSTLIESGMPATMAKLRAIRAEGVDNKGEFKCGLVVVAMAEIKVLETGELDDPQAGSVSVTLIKATLFNIRTGQVKEGYLVPIDTMFVDGEYDENKVEAQDVSKLI